MAYCRNCGNWLQDNATQCPNCGTPAVNNQPNYTQPVNGAQQPNYTQPVNGGNWGNQNNYQQPNFNQNNYQQPNFNQNNYQQPNYYQQPAAQPPKKKKGATIALVILLVVVAVIGIGLAVSLLGGSAKDDPNVGMYHVVSCTYQGSELELDGEWVELKANGKFSFFLEDETYTGKWSRSGRDITLTQAGDTFYGTVEDGILKLDLEGLMFVFAKDGAASGSFTPAATEAPAPVPPTEAPAETEAPIMNNDYSWWEGDWYGWWVVKDGTGAMAELESLAWDVCGTITVENNGTGNVYLWDQDESESQSVWDVDVLFEPGYDDRGVMVSVAGTFMNGYVRNKDWRVDPTEYPYSDFENFICITGQYTDSQDSSTGCTYYLFLRPWGTDWEDIRYGDMSEMPYTDMMPILYDSWYISHMYGSMPSRFNLD